MSSTPHLSLPQSPSASITDLPHAHDPPPLSATSASTPSAQSLPSASTSAPAPLPSPSRLHQRRPPVVPLSTDEEAAAARVSSRAATHLTADHISVLFPDANTPFQDIGDVVDRLLPYHVFQHPRADLLVANKGKRRATEAEILQSELAETKFALECFKRRSALEERFRRARTKSGKRTAYDDQAYYLERQALDLERADHSTLSTELRTAKAELERITRQQRLVAQPQRTNYYLSGTPVYAHHYRAYHYPYAQTYGASTSSAPTPPTPGYPYSVPLNSTVQYVPPPLATSTTAAKTSTAITPAGAPASTTPTPSSSTPTSNTAAPASKASPAGTSNVSSAIPVQLPVSWLPTLHALGIVPVPTQSVSADAPTPPAVLRGTSANGDMLNLEINVSLLQAAQMSGLALMLNSIMRGTSNSGATEGPPHAQVGAPYTYPYAGAQSLAPATVTTTPVNPGLNKVANPPQQDKLE
ncbi:Glioma tumor suppressor candidate region domain containing protein [Lactarius tabidus]